jgi:organic hydroperoxide reductase OsmC/OhrA
MADKPIRFNAAFNAPVHHSRSSIIVLADASSSASPACTSPNTSAHLTGLLLTSKADIKLEAVQHVDPEEAFVASLSSCHMLSFLAIACKQKFVLDSYEDEAVGHLEKNADGKLAITRVELRPKITWGGDRKPSAEELDKMHHDAHENCFITNSVKTEVRVTKI